MNKHRETESVHFIQQRFDEAKENSVIDYSNSDFQLNDVARINRRYHEWISAFLSGDLFVYADEPRSFSLIKDQCFIPYLNSCCLSTCYDMQFLFCLF